MIHPFGALERPDQQASEHCAQQLELRQNRGASDPTGIPAWRMRNTSSVRTKRYGRESEIDNQNPGTAELTKTSQQLRNGVVLSAG
jgi:hypothetical protein